MKKFAILLIAGALVSPVFAEGREGSMTQDGANASAVAASQDAPSTQPAS